MLAGGVRRGQTSRMSGEMRKFHVFWVALLLVGQMFVTATTARAATPGPLDPSPYCRPYANTPVAAGYWAAGGGHYSADFNGTLGVTCNGPVYKVVIYPVWHASSSPFVAGVGITSGSGKTCAGSCTTTMWHYRNSLFGGYHYTFTDQMQITGYWQRYSTSTKSSISVMGASRTGSAYKPPGVC